MVCAGAAAKINFNILYLDVPKSAFCGHLTKRTSVLVKTTLLEPGEQGRVNLLGKHYDLFEDFLYED